VRLALLDADVNFKVARDFIEEVKTKALGQEVVQSIQPGQQIIKVIHDELVKLLGSSNAGLALSGNRAASSWPACMVRAKRLPAPSWPAGCKTGAPDLARSPRTCTGRPRWINWRLWAAKSKSRSSRSRGKRMSEIARQALEFARQNQRNTLLFDTAGRLQIDQPLVQELARLRDLIQPQESCWSWTPPQARRQSMSPRISISAAYHRGDPDQAGRRRARRGGAQSEGGNRQAD